MNHVTPYICVDDCRAAIAWYAEVLEAKVVVEPIVMEDGRVGHCELDVDGARWMMSDAFDSAGVAAPDPTRHPAVSLHLTVADVDATAARAATAGITLDRGPEDTPHGRIAVFRDPFGHRWMLNSR